MNVTVPLFVEGVDGELVEEMMPAGAVRGDQYMMRLDPETNIFRHMPGAVRGDQYMMRLDPENIFRPMHTLIYRYQPLRYEPNPYPRPVPHPVPHNHPRLIRLRGNSEEMACSDDTICPVCPADFNDLNESNRCVTGCHHAFCIDCLNTWEAHERTAGRDFTCPVCRANILNVYTHPPKRRLDE